VAKTRPVDFSREVRPILSRYCFACHGPDERARKAELRLDVQDSATATRSSGTRAIVPGKPGESELVERVTTDDETTLMPPRKLGKQPTAAEVETLRRGIEQGAGYAKHWAYTPPVRHALPEVSDPSWPINPIDCFVLVRLDREAIGPSPSAARHDLLRRASL